MPLSLAPARQQLARLANGYAWRIDLGNAGRRRPANPCPAGAGAVVGGRSDGRGARTGAFANAPTTRCLWLFVDASKSGTRRWCDMASCGNRAKARRHYLKTKQG